MLGGSELAAACATLCELCSCADVAYCRVRRDALARGVLVLEADPPAALRHFRAGRYETARAATVAAARGDVVDEAMAGRHVRSVACMIQSSLC